jgi:VanZ family protein
VFDEWNQSFVPGRYGSLTDVVLDVTGAVLGSWLGDWMGAKAITSEETRDTIKRG